MYARLSDVTGAGRSSVQSPPPAPVSSAPAALLDPEEFEKRMRVEESYAIALADAMLAGIAVDADAMDRVKKISEARFGGPKKPNLAGLFRPERFFVPFTKVIVKFAKDVERLLREMGLETYSMHIAQQAQIEYKKSAATFMHATKQAIEYKEQNKQIVELESKVTEGEKKVDVASLPYQLQKARLAMLFMQFMFDETVRVQKDPTAMYNMMVERGVLRSSTEYKIRMIQVYNVMDRWIELYVNMEKSILMQYSKPELDLLPLNTSALPSDWLSDPFYMQPLDLQQPLKHLIHDPAETSVKVVPDHSLRTIKKEMSAAVARSVARDVAASLALLHSLELITYYHIDRVKLDVATHEDKKQLADILDTCRKWRDTLALDDKEVEIIDYLISCVETLHYQNSHDNRTMATTPYAFVPVRLRDRRTFWLNIGCKEVFEWLVRNKAFATSVSMRKLFPEFEAPLRTLYTRLRIQEQREQTNVEAMKRGKKQRSIGMWDRMVHFLGWEAKKALVREKLRPGIPFSGGVRFA